MLNTIEIREGGGRSWATLDLQNLSATGRLNPRLLLSFTARPTQFSKVVLSNVTLRLEHRQELVGEGRIDGVDITYDRAQVTFEVVTSQRLIQYVTEGLSPTSTVIQLDATLKGMGRFWLDPSAPVGQGRAKMVGDPEPGQWKDFEVSTNSPTSLQIARGEWYERVLAPTRNEQYRFLEVALPRSDKVLSAEWATTVRHLESAERSYASGDDPGVFLHLRGALDALPGAKQQILAAIGDGNKRTDLDGLLKQAGKFLHDGRHVAADGSGAGSFPVDHLDAALALDVMRVLLSHLSLLLSAESQRGSS